MSMRSSPARQHCMRAGAKHRPYQAVKQCLLARMRLAPQLMRRKMRRPAPRLLPLAWRMYRPPQLHKAHTWGHIQARCCVGMRTFVCNTLGKQCSKLT